MATLTIELDSLSREGAERIAAMILTYAGIEPQQELISVDVLDTGIPEQIKESIRSNREELSAAEAFRDASPLPLAGPQLVIPNPQPADVPIAQIPPPPSSVAMSAVGNQASASVQLDSAGLPHDPRIHSKEKSFNKDGTWRVRRGLPDGYHEQISEENRKLMAIPSPVQSAAASYGAVAATPTMPPPPPSTGNPPPPPADPMAFVNLATKVTSAISAKQIAPEQVQKVAESVGLQTFMQLAVRQDLVPVVAPLIDALLAGNASAQ